MSKIHVSSLDYNTHNILEHIDGCMSSSRLWPIPSHDQCGLVLKPVMNV